MKLPQTPPPVQETLDRARRTPERESLLLKLTVTGELNKRLRGRYLHWEELRRRNPPAGLSHEEWWAGIKLARGLTSKTVPGQDSHGRPLTFNLPDVAQEQLHEISRMAAGQIVLSEEVTSPEHRDRYVVSSLLEEAITSSQLEGAATTSRVARSMLRSGRRPVNRYEQMILNNFHGLEFVRETRDQRMTPELLLELHRVLTEDTLDDPDRAGHLRTTSDDIVVRAQDGTVLHDPPAADLLPGRIEDLCAFANGDVPSYFLHPVVRAIVLHYRLAYDHPFVDGNGRTARALFYWSMLAQEYWLFEYVSISTIVRKGPARYSRAFLFAETDDNDLTYFILYHLDAIRKAIESLTRYLRGKAQQLREVHDLIRESPLLNHRQLAIIGHGLRHPDRSYTIRSHQTSHRVVYETARTDLVQLVDLGLMRKRKVDRAFVFRFVSDLERRLRSLGAGAS